MSKCRLLEDERQKREKGWERRKNREKGERREQKEKAREAPPINISGYATGVSKSVNQK